MILEVYEGTVTVIPIVQASAKQQSEQQRSEQQRRKGKQAASATGVATASGDRVVGELGEQCPTRIGELSVRSSTFLYTQTKQKPRLALLYEDPMKRVRLRIRELEYVAGPGGRDGAADLRELEIPQQDLEMGASLLIPVPAPLGEFSILIVFPLALGKEDYMGDLWPFFSFPSFLGVLTTFYDRWSIDSWGDFGQIF